MIDRSESHLIAREQRNRGDASTTDGARAVRARRARAGIAHESGRATRVEPTVGEPKSTTPRTRWSSRRRPPRLLQSAGASLSLPRLLESMMYCLAR